MRRLKRFVAIATGAAADRREQVRQQALRWSEPEVVRDFTLERAVDLVPPDALAAKAEGGLRRVVDPHAEGTTVRFGPGLREHADEVAARITADVCHERWYTDGFRTQMRHWLAGQLRAEADRVLAAVTDPEMLVADRPAPEWWHRRDEPGLRQMIVQHRATGLRAEFIYGEAANPTIGFPIAKTYAIESIDPERPAAREHDNTPWSLYTGHGIGPAIYRRAAAELPGVRWRDNSVSMYGQPMRAKLHVEDPWRWASNQCVCRSEWADMTSDDAARAEHRLDR